MAYWTVVGCPRNDAAKARETRAYAARTDWVAEMNRIEAAAAILRAAGNDRRTERRLESLRIEWKSAARMRDYVATGINP